LLEYEAPLLKYEVFLAQEAFKLARKFEFHFTPKKGSWLNMAEIEFYSLFPQCLNLWIGDLVTLIKRLALKDKNVTKSFTTKLNSLLLRDKYIAINVKTIKKQI
jgi:hypothetical protein